MDKKVLSIQMTQANKEFYLKTIDEEMTVLGRIAGFRRMAHATGVKVLTPPYLKYNDEQRSNPHIVRDSGKMIEVVCRKIAFGLDFHGEPTAVDQTIIFNPLNYLAKKLIDLSKKYPGIAKIINKASLTAKELKDGLFIPIIDSGVSMVGVFVPSITHPELENIWSEHHDSVLYSERNAQTMCERSAIQKHPAIPTLSTSMLLDEGETLSVDLYQWDMDKVESQNLLSIASKIELGHEAEIKKTISIDELTEGH